MTDNEIVKALECCLQEYGNCDDCPYKEYQCVSEKDGNIFYKDILDLINRQKAEIERYKGVISILENDVKVASIEAVKGFAHFLIDRSKGGEIEVVDVADLAVEYMNRLGGKGNEQ